MDFEYIRLHQLVLRKVRGALYLGGGYRYDRYYDVVDHRLDLAAAPPVVTSHYAYNTYYGFPMGAYTVSSLSLSGLYDSRDSTINPYRGVYANLDYRISPTWLGSSKASSLLFGEVRWYLPLSVEVPRDVLAFWVMAQGVVTGEMPYLALPSTAWDARSVTGRGFVQGRFRGPAEVYGEVEVRFRITSNGLLGGSVFANAQTFSRPAVSIPGYQDGGEALFDKIVPGGGVGLRVLLNRDSRTNVRFDIAAGQDQVAFYMGAGEVF
jgi:outer membrane protein assembly factor BamA